MGWICWPLKGLNGFNLLLKFNKSLKILSKQKVSFWLIYNFIVTLRSNSCESLSTPSLLKLSLWSIIKNIFADKEILKPKSKSLIDKGVKLKFNSFIESSTGKGRKKRNFSEDQLGKVVISSSDLGIKIKKPKKKKKYKL